MDTVTTKPRADSMVPAACEPNLSCRLLSAAARSASNTAHIRRQSSIDSRSGITAG